MYNQNYMAQPMPSKKQSIFVKVPKWAWFALIAVVVIIAIVVAVVLISGAVENGQLQARLDEDDKNDGYSYEAAMADVDIMNTAYANAVKKSEHTDYVTEKENTLMFGLAPYKVCDALRVECSSLMKPEESTAFTEVGALNTNAIEYYLDNGHVVIISAYGGYPYTEEGNVVVIYAANYAQYHEFSGFIPRETGKTPVQVELGRTDMINSIIGIPRFFVSKEVF